MSIREKILTLIFLVLIQTNCFSQRNIASKYYNMFGEKIEFFSDSTFKHTWHFDLASSWTNGKWKISGDTIYLTTILVMDTLTISNPDDNISKDTLVLSSDTKSERIDNVEYVISSISSGGQNRRRPPIRLVIKYGKLFQILDNGDLDRMRHKAIMINKKYRTCFKPIRE